MSTKYFKQRTSSRKQKRTDLMHASLDLLRLGVRINMESTVKAVLQSGAVFSAYINTRF